MARKQKDVRSWIKIQSEESKHCYYTFKNRRNTTERLRIRKYDPTLRKHCWYKESK